jgi:hypothetical protein
MVQQVAQVMRPQRVLAGKFRSPVEHHAPVAALARPAGQKSTHPLTYSPPSFSPSAAVFKNFFRDAQQTVTRKLFSPGLSS